jgi:hypothetical protein
MWLKNNPIYVRFEVLTMVTVKMAFFTVIYGKKTIECGFPLGRVTFTDEGRS